MFASKDALFTAPSGYTIARSVRLRSSAQGYFSKTLTTPTNNKKWTYSVWMKRGSLSSNRTIMSSNVDGAEYWDMRFNTSDQIYIQNRVGSSNLLLANTTAVYRDPSAWYHIVFVFDSANATAANRNLLYVNGVNVSLSANSASGDASAWNTSGVQHNIGVSRTLTTGGAIWAEFDGYETEINFIDGQALTPSSFGSTNAITGVWQPAKYTGTYGTNGFYLNFSDNSSNTSTTIGKDYSGNGNNWTPNNISVTSGSTYDSMTDVPTLTSATAANYCVLSPIDKSFGTTGSIVDGNLATTSQTATANGTFWLTSGKWYFEASFSSITGASSLVEVGIRNGTAATGQIQGYQSNGNKDVDTTASAYGATYTTSDIIGCAFDIDNRQMTFYKNGTSQGSFTYTTVDSYTPSVIARGTTTFSASVNFGQRPFNSTPPSGYVALNTYNLPAGTITTSGSFTGNASADGPFVYLNGVPTAMTINGNSVTFGTNADHLANGFKVRSSSASYNASGSNTYSITTSGAKFKYANAQTNP